MAKKTKFECGDCGKGYLIEVKKSDLDKFNEGTPVQIAMPYLSKEQQTMILGKRCKKCTNAVLA